MIVAIVSLTGLALLFGLGLTVAARKLAVPVDPRVERVSNLLPGANCGACSYAGCHGAAEAIVAGKIPVGSCPVAGQAIKEEIAGILRVEIDATAEQIALVRCAGGLPEAPRRFAYHGIQECRAAELVGGGEKSCRFGCLGLGTCERICPFRAIRIIDGVAVVDPDACTGCGKCIGVCPRNLIVLVPKKEPIHILCSSHDKGAKVRKLCSVGCIACQACVKKASGEEVRMEDNLAVRDYTKPLMDRAVVEACPTGTILDTRECSPLVWATRHPKKEKKKKDAGKQ